MCALSRMDTEEEGIGGWEGEWGRGLGGWIQGREPVA